MNLLVESNVFAAHGKGLRTVVKIYIRIKSSMGQFYLTKANIGKLNVNKGLQPRHAKLAVGAASTLSVFLAETHKLRGSKKG